MLRERRITGLWLRRQVRTTLPALSDTPVPDLGKPTLAAAAPNRVDVGDISYLPYDPAYDGVLRTGGNPARTTHYLEDLSAAIPMVEL